MASLIQAIQDGKNPKIPKLNKRNKEILAEALFEAARLGREEIVEEALLAAKAPLTFELEYYPDAESLTQINIGDTVLHVAVVSKNENIVRMLLNAGMDASPFNYMSGLAPIHYAARYGESMVRLFLEAGVDVDAMFPDGGCTPAHCAAMYNNFEALEVLVEAGADLDEFDEEGQTPLHLACVKSEEEKEEINIKIIKYLIEEGADVDAQADPSTYPPLVIAARSGNAAAVKLLIAAGADIETRGARKNESILMYAMESANPQIFKLLLAAGANISLRDKMDASVMMYWAPFDVYGNAWTKQGVEEMLELLVKDHGFSFNETDKFNSTPLLELLRGFCWGDEKDRSEDHLGALEAFLEAGADAKFTGGDGGGVLGFFWLAFCFRNEGDFGNNADDTWTEEKIVLWATYCETAGKMVELLIRAGAEPLIEGYLDSDGYKLLENLKDAAIPHNVVKPYPLFIALIKAGIRGNIWDRYNIWDVVPSPCPGLGGALLSVWENNPDQLPRLFEKLEEKDQERVQMALRGLYRVGKKTEKALLTELQMQILTDALKE